jgi:hypothetical protein
MYYILKDEQIYKQYVSNLDFLLNDFVKYIRNLPELLLPQCVVSGVGNCADYCVTFM